MKIFVNGSFREGYAADNPVLYASPYLVANPTGYTKYIYADSERIASKTGGDGFSDINRHINMVSIDAKKAAHNTLYTRSQDCLIFPLIPVSMKKNRLNILYNFINFVSLETDIYYYHSDHLGSSSWITFMDGSAIQHMWYHPFGETAVDQRTGDWNARYTFSGKEKDEETGYHYFGARYYDSDLSIWFSVDPLASKYSSLSPYVYCANNPISLRDPNGMDIDGVTYNKKTKEFSYSDANLARSTDKYILSRMETKSGSQGIMRMVNSEETFSLHVTDKPIFVTDNVDNRSGYTQIEGIAENNNIYISTYSFDNQGGDNNFSNSLLINLDGNSANISINPADVFSGTGTRNDDYDRVFRASGLEKFVNTPENEFKSQKQFIHGMGVHEERHLFQITSLNTPFKRESDAMRQERFERKQYIKTH